MSIRRRLRSLVEKWCDRASGDGHSDSGRKPGSNVFAMLSLVAAIGSTVAAFLAWDAARNANQVSRASQALALKVYNDQIALGHPSVSVLSGETSISVDSKRGYRSEGVNDYVATLTLRNSGQRDAPRAWAAFYSDGFAADSPRALRITLPKEIDVGVRFSVGTLFGTDETESSGLVAIIYQDEVPSPMLGSISELSAPGPLRMVCAQPVVFRVTSWPKDLAQDPAIRLFSSGTPITAEQMSLEWYGGEEAAKRVSEVRHEVIRAAHSNNACLDVSGAAG